MTNELHETRESLWLLVASPLVWAAHFLACYITAAVWCEKIVEPGDSLAGVRTAHGVYTVVALAVIFVVGVRGLRRHRRGRAELPHDADTPEDRHRFLGFATLLLSGLSAVAVLFTSFVAVVVGDCH
jgi:hypothetical protein